MPRHNNLLTWLSALSVACLVSVTVMVARQTFVQLPTEAGVDRPPPREVDNWAELFGTGHRLGPDSAKVLVVEFGDYQCPYCKRFHDVVWRAVEARFAGRVALIYRHWPLSIHKHAYSASRAAFCANDQGLFKEIHTLLYAKQDSIGAKTFSSFAKESGIQDLPLFEQCMRDTIPHARVEEDIAMATSIGARGTPTVIVGGLRFFSPPDTATLFRVISEKLNGQ